MIVYQAESPDNTASYLIVVIEPDNFRRMREGDPITLNPVRMGGLLEPVEHPKKLHLLICYEEEEVGKVYDLIAKRDLRGLLDYLLRGYQFLTNDGKWADMKKKGTA